MERTPQKVATIQNVLEDLWDSSNQPHLIQALEADALRRMSELGEVVSDLHREVRRENPWDGFDLEGNKIQPMVAVCHSAYAIPHKES